MNKKELIARVQRHMGPGATRDAAGAAVDAVTSAILAAAAEHPVSLRGLGSFEYRLRQERRIYDINAKRTDVVPAARHLGFVSSKPLRQLVASARRSSTGFRPQP